MARQNQDRRQPLFSSAVTKASKTGPPLKRTRRHLLHRQNVRRDGNDHSSEVLQKLPLEILVTLRVVRKWLAWRATDRRPFPD